MWVSIKVIGFIVFLSFIFADCKSFAGVDLFSDISDLSGVNASHSSSTFGIGLAWIDVENDGDLDIYVTDQQGPNHLLINQGDETFIEMAQYQSVNLPNQACSGVSIADYDNDGWDDIYVNCLGDNHLFKNNSGQSFSDVTSVAGVNDMNRSQVSAWADINNDGWLDLYVVNFNNGQTVDTASAKDSFFLSNGDSTFSNINSDLDDVNLLKPGLAVTFFDYDNDGDQDLYILIDKLHGNVLWRNDGPATQSCGSNWCFTDVSSATGTGMQIYGMGIATGDIDLDGDLDMYFTSVGEQFLLLNQTSQGNPVFIDVSVNSILNVPKTAGWGTLFFDYDNDSYLDAMIATYGSTVATAEKLFKGNGDATFVDVTSVSGISDLIMTEGIAFGDMNNDGLLDLLKGNRNSGYKLYKNNSTLNNNWVEFKLMGYDTVNRNAIGTRVDLLLSNGETLIREVVSGDARGSGNQRSLHFGLGTGKIVSATIKWTDGITENMTNIPHNFKYNIVNPSGRVIFLNGFE